jgi:hypothetical protein
MAELRNDSGALRFGLALAARAQGTGLPEPGAGASLLAAAGLEYLDRRDGDWWPLARLPVLYLPADAVEGLKGQLLAFLAGATPGFAWRPGEGAALGLQLGAVPGGAVVEVGLDLGGFLAESAGVAPRTGGELALFRFRSEQPALVLFADQLGQELGTLGP